MTSARRTPRRRPKAPADETAVEAQAQRGDGAPRDPGDYLGPTPKPEWTDRAFEVVQCSDDDGIQHVGVVLVHGVGFQASGETMRSWVQPMVRLLRERLARVGSETGPDPVRITDTVSPLGPDLPFVELRMPAGPIPGRHVPQHWAITEAFWADHISPPDLQTVALWLGPDGGLARAAGEMASPNDPRIPGRRRLQPFNTGALVSRRVIVSILGTLFLLLYLLVKAVSAVVPLGLIQERVIAPMERFLTSWAGDMRTLLSDEQQAASVRGRVARAAKALEDYGCDDIVLVAHSGGAVASYLTLTDPVFANLKIRKLLTFGQGLNIAYRLIQRDDVPLRLAHRLELPLTTYRPRISWRDWYATEDPVPQGPVRPPAGEPGPDQDSAVSNRWSAREDHGGYWDNDEEFLLPLLREISEPRATAEASRFEYTDETDTTRRRRQRLSGLALWRHFCFTAGAAAVFASFATGLWDYYSDPLQGLRPAVDTYLPLLRLLGDREGPGWVTGLVDAIRAQAPVWPLLAVGYLFWPIVASFAILSLVPQYRRWQEPWQSESGVSSGIVSGLIAIVQAAVSLVAFAGLLIVVPGLIATGLGSTKPLWVVVRPFWSDVFTFFWNLFEVTPLPPSWSSPLAGLFTQGVFGYGLLMVLLFLWALLRRVRLRALRDRLRDSGPSVLGTLVAQGSLVAGVIVAAVAILLLVSVLYALVADRAYAYYLLALLLTFVPFVVLAGIGAWRWRMWDERERREFRTGERYAYGRVHDLVGWTLLAAATSGFAIALGLGRFFSDVAVTAGFFATATLILAVVYGGVQDALNRYVERPSSSAAGNQ